MYVVTEMLSTVLKEIVLSSFFMQLCTLLYNLIPILTAAFIEKLLCYATEYGDPVFSCVMIVNFYILLQIFLVSFNIADYFNYVYTSCQFQ
jgi:hypothetical protein